MPGRRKNLIEGFPEAERAVTDRNLWCDRKTTRLQIDKQFFPALRALAHARLEAEHLLLALRCGAYEHQHAFGLGLHARLQIDAVGPDVDVAPRRQIAGLPASIFVLPLALQPRDHGWRKIGRVLAEQSRQDFLKIAG